MVQRSRPCVCVLRLACQRDRKRESLHLEGKPFVVRADEKLTAFLELESAIRRRPAGVGFCVAWLGLSLFNRVRVDSLSEI